MRWKRGSSSKHVEDRRGRSGKLMAGGIGSVIAVVLVLIFGKDALPFLQGDSGSGSKSEPIDPAKDPDRELKDFITFVLNDVQDTWVKAFPKAYGKPYEHAILVLFDGRVRSACGRASSAIGPFYCPADNKAYIDLSFYRALARKFEAPGDFAQAYVIAHEIGHHIQNLVGTSAEVHRFQKANPDEANAASVKLELQADCLAGVWAYHADRRGVLEVGDIEEGLAAASAIGDDTLQRKSSGDVNPESWTHGSSDQRVRWFKRGHSSGDVDRCDTFDAAAL
jgi:hypothetical protein